MIKVSKLQKLLTKLYRRRIKFDDKAGVLQLEFQMRIRAIQLEASIVDAQAQVVCSALNELTGDGDTEGEGVVCSLIR